MAHHDSRYLSLLSLWGLGLGDGAQGERYDWTGTQYRYIHVGVHVHSEGVDSNSVRLLPGTNMMNCIGLNKQAVRKLVRGRVKNIATTRNSSSSSSSVL